MSVQTLTLPAPVMPPAAAHSGTWMREKIAADVQACALLRRCGQSTVVLSLTGTARGGRPVRS